MTLKQIFNQILDSKYLLLIFVVVFNISSSFIFDKVMTKYTFSTILLMPTINGESIFSREELIHILDSDSLSKEVMHEESMKSIRLSIGNKIPYSIASECIVKDDCVEIINRAILHLNKFSRYEIDTFYSSKDREVENLSNEILVRKDALKRYESSISPIALEVTNNTNLYASVLQQKTFEYIHTIQESIERKINELLTYKKTPILIKEFRTIYPVRINNVNKYLSFNIWMLVSFMLSIALYLSYVIYRISPDSKV